MTDELSKLPAAPVLDAQPSRWIATARILARLLAVFEGLRLVRVVLAFVHSPDSGADAIPDLVYGVLGALLVAWLYWGLGSVMWRDKSSGAALGLAGWLVFSLLIAMLTASDLQVRDYLNLPLAVFFAWAAFECRRFHIQTRELESAGSSEEVPT